MSDIQRLMRDSQCCVNVKYDSVRYCCGLATGEQCFFKGLADKTRKLFWTRCNNFRGS